MQVLNQKTLRSWQKGSESRTITVSDRYIYFSRALERALALKRDDRLAFEMDGSTLRMYFDQNEGLRLSKKNVQNCLVIHCADLSRILSKYGKVFSYEKFMDGKYIMRKIQ